MSEMTNNKLLSLLIEEAKKIGNGENPSFTAERYIVAIIDMIKNEQSLIDYPELKVLKDDLSKISDDLDKSREILMEYILQEKSSFADVLYIKKKQQKAKEYAEKFDKTEITASILLMAMNEDPTSTMRAAFTYKEKDDSQILSTPKPECEDNKPTPEEVNEAIKKMIKSDGASGETKTTSTNDECNSSKESSNDTSLDDIMKAIDDLLDDLKEVEETLDEEAKAKAEAKSKLSCLVNEVKNIRTELGSCVYGQDNAINVFATGYFQASMLDMTDKERIRPKATFLFAGPPGVGKTFLAEKAAKALKLPFKRFDMSEYSDKEANLEFCGSDKVYKNAKSGNVTSFVAENPKCVLLFDEIEKAHLCVIHLFLQILDAGRLRDNYTDEEVSFKDAIIILTTNAGKQLYEESESGDFSGVSRKVIIKALQNDKNPTTGAPYFPGAICSRFASGNVVMFNQMGAHHLRAIAKKEIQRHASNVEIETGIKFEIDETVYTALLLSEGSAADARTIRGRAETFFNDEFYELLRLVASTKVKTDIDNVEKINIGVDLSQANKEIVSLFTHVSKPQALVFAPENVVEMCKAKTKDVEMIGVQSVKAATEELKTKDIAFVLLDMKCGAKATTPMSLNLEDVESDARDFFKMMKEQKSELPIYLIMERDSDVSDEEKISFMRQGVRGTLRITRGKDSFASQIKEIASNLHQQASMIKLAKENKLVSFETAQSISKNGKNAQIKLFDFEMKIALDSEDAKNVLSAVSKPNVHFDDIIGAQGAKDELTYFIEYLKNPKKYMGTGVKAPKGVLLYGPPGTGKTMLAKAMASESGVTFIAAEGNEFLKKYVGEGSERVHELFKTARKYAPSILFVDEIDAIAKERRGGENAGSSGEGTLTAFLTEMDGFSSDPSKPVFVLAATNFDVEPGTDMSLDPALMRRFDRRVYIDLPNKNDRIKFLKMKSDKNKAIQLTDEMIDNIAVRSTGMSLADLDSIIEFALRSAIREGSVIVDDAIFEEAFETFTCGDVKKWDDSTLERVARHEAGHALICYLSGETPSYLTVVARGDHGGYMQHADDEGKAIYTKEELLSKIRISLGGRAAEIVYYGEKDGISTGASGDLYSATATAQRIVCSYGMDEGFGLAVASRNADGDIAALIRSCVNSILDEQMKLAIKIISENKGKIDSLVEELINKNHLNGIEIEQAIKKADLN